MKPISILVVDDETLQRETLAAILSDHGHLVVTAFDVPSALAALQAQEFDVVLTDFRIPGGSGIDVARKASEMAPECAIMIMTAYADVASVIDAMRVGVLDYLLKPLNVEAILRRLEGIRERQELRLEVNFLRRETHRIAATSDLLGQSAQVAAIRDVIGQVAQTRGTVLITGESGTGKEVVARSIHQSSPQADKRFVAINCGALPEHLLESELFGHKRGAFTGAVANKQGLFAVASEGTIFLDEIGEMPKSLQVKLLRVIQEREFTPVGDTHPVKISVRIIAATNRDLSQEVAAGNFRQDLFYRINVVEIRMPPLRERPEDIPLLAQHFVAKYAKEMGQATRPIASEAMRCLVQYGWPGNVRELENIIERALILSKCHDRIDLGDLPVSLASGQKTSQGHDEGDASGGLLPLEDAVKQFARAHIQRTLVAFDGDKKEAAKALGMGLSSLYRKLEELGIGAKAGAQDPR